MSSSRKSLDIIPVSLLVLAAAIALLVHTVTTSAGIVTRVGAFVSVLVLALVAVGLWTCRNAARIFLFFLLVLGALGSLAALFAYALPQSQHRLTIWLIVQVCIAVLLLWYLQRPAVRQAFGGTNAWPNTVKMLILTIFSVLLAFPFFWMAVATFKQNIDLYAMENNPFLFNLPPTLDHLRYLFNETHFVLWLGNTALVGLMVVAITLLLSLPAAYALARLTGKWGEGIGIGIFLTYLVPPTLLFIPLSRVIADLGLQDTIWALVLVYPSVTVPFSIWLLMGFFKSIPKELEDAAMVDGLTRFGAFVKLVVPISLSGILTVVIFTFTLVTQEFVYALTFISPERKQMVGVGIPIFLVRGDVYYWGALMAACLIASLPVAFLYNLFLDRFIAGFTVGAVKG